RLANDLAQGRNRDARGAGEWVGVFVPRLLQQGLSAHDAAGCPHEDFEDGELLSGELEVTAGAVSPATERIEPEVGELQEAGRGRGGAAGERSQAHDELLEGERLGEVVVGADLEAAYLVAQACGRGQHEDTGAGVGAGDMSADFVAVGARNV